MACFHPKKFIKIDKNYRYPSWLTITGKYADNQYGMIPSGCHELIIRHALTGVVKVIKETDFILAPCGQCRGCRLAESVERANRCILEAKSHENNYFLTLTYDDEHLVYGNEAPTLIQYHIRKFNKDLRRQLDYNGLSDKENPMKIMYCGEYGDESMRPHYHSINCGLKIPDLKFYKMNFDGDRYYTSEFLSNIWREQYHKEPRGFVVVGECSWNSCAYVGRYVMKKLKGRCKSFYDLNCLAPEFIQSSMKMGSEFYETYKDKIYHDDKIIIPAKNGYKEIKPPKTFDKWFEAESPEDFANLKDYRQANAKEILKQELSNTDLNLDDYLHTKELIFTEKFKALKRSAV